jgi:hypothetical protein
MENESLKITWFTSYNNAILKGQKKIKVGKIVFGSSNLSHVFSGRDYYMFLDLTYLVMNYF